MATISIPFAMQDTVGAALNPALQAWPEILGTIYVAHYRYVLQVCRRFLRQREDAEDAASEVFLKLQRVWHTKDVALPFRPWVSRVAGRHCIDKLRKRRRESRHTVEEEQFTDLPDISTASPLARVLLQEQQRQVTEELRRLPRQYRIHLVLRYYRRMSYTEIARTLGKQLPAIRMTLFRAKRELHGRLLRLREQQTVQDYGADVFSPAAETLVE